MIFYLYTHFNNLTNIWIYAFLDIETKIINKKFIPDIIVLYENGEYYTFREIAHLFMHLFKLNKNLVIYIHNINFDGILIIEYMTKTNIFFNIFTIKTNIYYIHIVNNKQKIELRCSFKLYPKSLDEIATKLFKQHKLPYPYKILSKDTPPDKVSIADFNSQDDYTKYILLNNSANFNYVEYTTKYCKNDVMLTKNFVETYWRIISSLGLGDYSSSYSASTISVNIFFNNFNKYKIEKKISENISTYIRKSYFGGRCEVFGNPYDNDYIFHFDYAGMYGQVMLEKFPIGEGTFSYSKDIDTPGFYYIEWYINNDIPILPMKTQSGKLIFYTGSGEGLYWFEEIKLFLENGGVIKKIKHAYLFKNMDYIFYDFIKTMNCIRAEGGIYKEIGKLLINSFYGRLGMKEINTKTIIFNKKKFQQYADKIISYTIINDTIIAEIKNHNVFKSKISNPIMASIITAKARIKLYNGFKTVNTLGGRLLYCDTDSIIASYVQDMTGIKLNDISYDENSRICDAVFARPKTYSVLYKSSYETKIKGMTRNLITFKTFKKKFYSKEYVQDSNMLQINKAGFTLHLKHVEKTSQLHGYDKRIFYENLKKTKPICL